MSAYFSARNSFKIRYCAATSGFSPSSLLAIIEQVRANPAVLYDLPKRISQISFFGCYKHCIGGARYKVSRLFRPITISTTTGTAIDHGALQAPIDICKVFFGSVVIQRFGDRSRDPTIISQS